MTTQATRPDLQQQQAARRRWQQGGVLLGLGLGGFFDGIVVHQILQWHHMVSAVYPPDTLENLRLNTLADGFFHAVDWVFTLLGALLLWRGLQSGHAAWQTSSFLGTLLVGWGLFNLVEGLINHQILGVHHVRPGPDQLAYDLGFLAWGAGMLGLGAWLMRRGPSRT